MFYKDVFALTSALTLIARTRDNAETNPLRCPCCPQALIPLSYAAHIPITHNLDIANVRLLFSDVDIQVGRYPGGMMNGRECVRRLRPTEH